MKKIYPFILLSICLLNEKKLFAQPGSLDPSFGLNGKFILGKNFSSESVQDIALTKDGKILMLAHVGGSFMMRFNMDGSFDSSFGKVSVGIGYYGENSQSIAVDDSNRIYVMTWAEMYGPEMYLNRYSPDGSLDPSYNFYNSDLSFAFGYHALFIQSNGKIVVAGTQENTTTATAERLNQNGTLDATFGINGVINFLGSNSECIVIAAAEQSDGKLLFCGTNDGSLFITRLLEDGTPDISWGIAGTEFLSDGTKSVAQDIAETNDGKVIVTGYTENGDSISSFKCWRFQSDGSPDYFFGWPGVTLATGHGHNWGSFVFSNPDSSMIAGGTVYNGSTDDAKIFRLTATGEVDSSFGNNGSVAMAFTCSRSVELYAMRDSAGNIFIGGTKYSSGNSYAAVAKILPSGNLDTAFALQGITPNLAANQVAIGSLNDFQILPDGNLLCDGGANGYLAMMRLSADGVADTSFGENGIYIEGQEYVTSPLFGEYRNNNIYVIQRFQNPVFGYDSLLDSYWGGGGSSDFLIRKFLPNGIPDSSYGTFSALHPTVTGYYLNSCSNAILQSDGKLLLIGTIELQYGREIYMLRLNTDGTTDENFGVNGITIVNYFNWDAATNVAFDSQERIILQYDDNPFGALMDTFLIFRFLQDGTLDASFGDNGLAKHPIAYGGGLNGGMQIQSDDKILSLITNDNYGGHYFILRFNQNGVIDSTYGTNGRASLFKFPFFNGFNYKHFTLQQDGKALCLGVSPLTLIRLTTDGKFDSTFSDDGISYPDTLSSSPTVGAMHLQDDGKILICGYVSQGFYMSRILNDIETGIPSQQQLSSIDVFPNPFGDALYVKLSGEKYESGTVRLFDLLGNEVLKKEILSNQNFLSVKIANLPSGIYFLNVKNGEKSFTVKVVKSL